MRIILEIKRDNSQSSAALLSSMMPVIGPMLLDLVGLGRRSDPMPEPLRSVDGPIGDVPHVPDFYGQGASAVLSWIEHCIRRDVDHLGDAFQAQMSGMVARARDAFGLATPMPPCAKCKAHPEWMECDHKCPGRSESSSGA